MLRRAGNRLIWLAALAGALFLLSAALVVVVGLVQLVAP